MKRYWLANSSETPPSPPSSTVGGYPQDGNIALNHKPTKVGAWWYHMITEEFMAVIERAGLTPSHENLHQLADIFDDFKQRAQGAETFKDQAVAAADRAEKAADQVVNDVSDAIAEEAALRESADTALGSRIDNIGSSLATVATTGAYSDLTGKPTIPTVPANVSAFNNDVPYATKGQLDAIVGNIETLLAEI